MLVPGGVQFGIGGVLEGEQGVVGARKGLQDLVEVSLLALLGVWMTHVGGLAHRVLGKRGRSGAVLVPEHVRVPGPVRGHG